MAGGNDWNSGGDSCGTSQHAHPAGGFGCLLDQCFGFGATVVPLGRYPLEKAFHGRDPYHANVGEGEGMLSSVYVTGFHPGESLGFSTQQPRKKRTNGVGSLFLPPARLQSSPVIGKRGQKNTCWLADELDTSNTCQWGMLSTLIKAPR